MTTQLAVATGARDLVTESDVQILRKSLFKTFNDHEVEYCVKISNLLSLNPILKQIHFVKRNTKDGPVISVQTGIDGFRLTAQRAGGYAGSDDAVFEYGLNDPQKKRPVKATVTVYRIVNGQRCAFSASARWEEYYSPQGGMWDRMPHNQLAKCAEALALRKAFPAELSALRSDEEMEQADRPDKAEALKKQIEPEKPVIEVQSAPVESESLPPCPNCSGMNVMKSLHTPGKLYCKGCRSLY